ncbi:MAG: hypothetical protein LBK76_06700 [Verrucomicrobiales bacterium]|nr:hypothetical protein [Verrucomicrobiales bacterium]
MFIRVHPWLKNENNEFARGKNHVNGIESFWRFAKSRRNKLHGTRQQKFFMHLK